MKQKRNTIIFIACLILLVGISFLIQSIFFQKEGAKVILEQRGRVIAELDLSKDTVYEVDDSIGGTNTVVIEDGTVYVSEANCPDLTCVRTGRISTTGVPIACLPHGLIITIQDASSEIDSQVY